MSIIAGIDEVGRGALAGPVVVAAAVVPDEPSFRIGLVEVLRREPTDSKKLTRLQRERAAAFLQETISFGIGEGSIEEIQNFGIVGACRLASTRALDRLSAKPTYVVADAGLRHGHESVIKTEWFVKGDETHLPITCASIIAKVYRDALLHRLAEQHPHYGWDRNAGYGTKEHQAAIRAHGPCSHHRLSFLGTL